MSINKHLTTVGLLITSTIIISSFGTNPKIQSAQMFGGNLTKFQESTNNIADDIYDAYQGKVQNFQTDIDDLHQQRNAVWDDCEKYLMGKKTIENPCHNGFVELKSSAKTLNIFRKRTSQE